MRNVIIAGFVTGALAYLIGSVSFAIVVTKLFTGKDIRTMGSGNAGMTNVLRSVGVPAAAITAAGDILKGTASVLIGRYLFSYFTATASIYGAYIAAICAILGHLFPVYFKFKGGKGVSVAAGSVVAINPILVAVLLLVFLFIIAITKIVSLASITVAALYPLVTAVYAYYNGQNILINTLFAAIIGFMVIVMHRGNIKRLLSGTEYKFGDKKK